MRCTYRHRRGIDKEKRDAVGGLDCEAQQRIVRDDDVAGRNARVRGGQYHGFAMHLPGTVKRVEGQVKDPGHLIPGGMVVASSRARTERPVVRREKVRREALQFTADQDGSRGGRLPPEG